MPRVHTLKETGHARGVNAQGICERLGAFKTLGKRFKRWESPLYKQIKVVSVFRVRMKCWEWRI